MSTPDILQVSAEIAEAWLEDAYLDPIWTEDENGDEVYTEDAQDRFNDILDVVQGILDDWIK